MSTTLIEAVDRHEACKASFRIAKAYEQACYLEKKNAEILANQALADYKVALINLTKAYATEKGENAAFDEEESACNMCAEADAVASSEVWGASYRLTQAELATGTARRACAAAYEAYCDAYISVQGELK